MESQIIESIIKTLCYHEIFSYPLTFSESSKYLISRKKVSDRELLFAFSKYRSLFEEEKGFIVLKNSKSCIKERIKRMVESRKKLAKALFVSQILSYIPTIQLIGISGSLSMYNAKKDDDIDLFFITSKNSLWLTRFLVVCTLFILRQKRQVGKNFYKDKICPNMFLTEDTLEMSGKSRNLYTAHEIAQLKIIYAKNDMKERFLASNKWVLRYLPHAFSVQKISFSKNKGMFLLPILDNFFFTLQKMYMRKKKTIEVVEKDRAFFHPVKMGNIITQIYKLKVLHRKKLLDKTEVFVPVFARPN